MGDGRIIAAAVLWLVGGIFLVSAVAAWRIGEMKGGNAAHFPLYKKDHPLAFAAVVAVYGGLGLALLVAGVYEITTGRP